MTAPALKGFATSALAGLGIAVQKIEEWDAVVKFGLSVMLLLGAVVAFVASLRSLVKGWNSRK